MRKNRPQQGEAAEDEQRDRALVTRYGSGQRAVAEVDLKDAGGPTDGGEAQRHIHLYKLAEAELAGGLAVRAGRHNLPIVGPAGERVEQVITGRTTCPINA